jgi:hypothetical protein
MMTGSRSGSSAHVPCWPSPVARRGHPRDRLAERDVQQISERWWKALLPAAE